MGSSFMLAFSSRWMMDQPGRGTLYTNACGEEGFIWRRLSCPRPTFSSLFSFCDSATGRLVGWMPSSRRDAIIPTSQMDGGASLLHVSYSNQSINQPIDWGSLTLTLFPLSFYG